MRTGGRGLARVASIAVVALASVTCLSAGSPAGAGAGAGAGHVPAGRAAAARATCPASPFTAAFGAYLGSRWPRNRFTAAVDDTRTGCHYDLRPDLRLTTASVIKIEIMTGILLRAQRQGRALSQWETDRIWPMITQSANTPASELWNSLGGIPAMQALERELGLRETVAAGPTWGLTTTSASDRNRVLRQVLLGQYGPLDATHRAIARSYMLKVTPSQRWGVTAGAPPGWAVPLKNGFYGSTCCRWRINSSGVVERPDRSALVVTILSDGWATDRDGIEAVDLVSRVIQGSLAAPYPPFPSPAAHVARQFTDVLGRAPSFPESYLHTAATGFATATAGALPAALVTSDEADRSLGIVLRLHLGTIKRLPDASVTSLWAWRLRTGRARASDLAAEIAASRSFAATGLSDADFAVRAVTAMLGRPPSTATRDGWVRLLSAGATRGQLLASLAGSAEARTARRPQVGVAALYTAMLGRSPSAQALGSWAAQVLHGTSTLARVAAYLHRSAEYRTRVG